MLSSFFLLNDSKMENKSCLDDLKVETVFH
jgi:hypothetical protein